MTICVKCRREMRCVKNGIGAEFGAGHVYAGDKYRCPECGHEVLLTNKVSHHDPEHKCHDEYFMMRKSENG